MASGGTPRSERLRQAIPTIGSVTGRGFLGLGAAVGATGWGVTAVLTVRPGVAGPFDPALLATVAWVPLVALMIGVGLLATPDAVRFARPFGSWAPANGLASVATVAALSGWLPPQTYWMAWALAGATGYLGTWLAVRRTGRDGRLWLAAAACETAVVVGGVTVAGVWPVLLLGTAHVVPLTVAASGLQRRLGSGAPLVPVIATGLVLAVAMGGA